MKKKHKSRRSRRFLLANKAATALEYAILTGVVTVGIGAAVATFQDEVVESLTNLGALIDGTTVTGAGTAINP